MSAEFATTRIISSLISSLASMFFNFLRFAERLFPPGVMSLLLCPPAAAWDLLHVYWRKPVESWRHFPKRWHPNPVRFFLRQSFGLFHPRLVYLWPDRLHHPRWLDRRRLGGGPDLRAS